MLLYPTFRSFEGAKCTIPAETSKPISGMGSRICLQYFEQSSLQRRSFRRFEGDINLSSATVMTPETGHAQSWIRGPRATTAVKASYPLCLCFSSGEIGTQLSAFVRANLPDKPRGHLFFYACGSNFATVAPTNRPEFHCIEPAVDVEEAAS